MHATVHNHWLAQGNTLNTSLIAATIKAQHVAIKSTSVAAAMTLVTLEVAPGMAQAGQASEDMLGLLLAPTLSFLVASDVSRVPGEGAARRL